MRQFDGFDFNSVNIVVIAVFGRGNRSFHLLGGAGVRVNRRHALLDEGLSHAGVKMVHMLVRIKNGVQPTEIGLLITPARIYQYPSAVYLD
jgi:hypothetical protein